MPCKPMTSTGVAGPASKILCPCSLNMARTCPHSLPAMMISPTFRVPFCTSRVATEPRPFSILASMTVPLALQVGSALRSRISACSRIASTSLSMLIRFLAETSAHRLSPPISSTAMPCCKSAVLTFSGSAPGRSILLMATTIGTSAAWAWRMASTVCGMMPSLAATTSTTMSVTLAPRARISENASCPGVSMKVIFCPSPSVIW